MKITKTIRDLYNDNKRNADLLFQYTNEKLKYLCSDNDWLYESRVKSEISFALKLETGRNPFDDFFACRIIVIKQNDIEKVLALLNGCDIEILERKPEEIKKTDKNPEDFSFNDIRLYVKFKQKANLPEKQYLNQVFEIQIIPFFNYTWAKTTHDLIYKNDTLSWGRRRIAYQIKALLEQAQYAIDTIEQTQETYFPKNLRYEEQLQIINFLKEHWKDRLPNDLIRLSNSIMSFLKKANSNIEEFKKIIELENENNRGSKLLNISPFQAIIKSYSIQKPTCFENLKKGNFKIVVTDEIDLNEEVIKKLKNEEKIIDYRKQYKASNEPL